jgi:hypothetical protein
MEEVGHWVELNTDYNGTCSSGSTNHVSMNVIQYNISQIISSAYGLALEKECAMSMGRSSVPENPSNLGNTVSKSTGDVAWQRTARRTREPMQTSHEWMCNVQ